MKDFSIKFRKLIEWKYFGSFQSIFKWSGIEISDFRKYISGDSFRIINRKLSAKHNELFVNKFHNDQEIELDIFLDINYNWKYWKQQQQNYEIFMQYFSDIIVYCRKNMINMKISYTKNDKNELKTLEVHKNIEIAYEFLKKFPDIIKKIPRKYFSSVRDFVEISKKKKKRRAILIFSDFLDLEEKDIKIIKHLDKEHALFLIKIQIDNNYGQNYERFFVDQKLLSRQDNLVFQKME